MKRFLLLCISAFALINCSISLSTVAENVHSSHIDKGSVALLSPERARVLQQLVARELTTLPDETSFNVVQFENRYYLTHYAKPTRSYTFSDDGQLIFATYIIYAENGLRHLVKIQPSTAEQYLKIIFEEVSSE